MPRHRRCHVRYPAGFSLMEMLVVLSIFTLIVYGLVGSVADIFKQRRLQTVMLTDVDQVQRVANQVTNELRNALTGGNGAYVLDTAQAQQIIFYAEADAASANVERVRYWLASGQLYRGLTKYSGGTYNPATEVAYAAQDDVANGATPLFYYYDGSYTGAANQNPLAQPVNVTTVKFVKVNLQVYTKSGLQNTSFFTVTASAAVRNLKTNLGQ